MDHFISFHYESNCPAKQSWPSVACMKSLEAKLIKQNRLTEFNEAFKDIVHRGVFKELFPQDIEEWGGPVNFISLVCAYKSGPHQSTLLKLCINSSMICL